jgi:hypothetical protein
MLEVAADGRAVATVWAFEPRATDKRPQGRQDYIEEPEGQANARLIESAPEMADLLARILEVGVERPQIQALLAHIRGEMPNAP